MYLLVYITAILVNSNSMLNNISNLQFQQILKHPQFPSVGIPNLSKTYTHKAIVKMHHIDLHVLQTFTEFICIHYLHHIIATAFSHTITSKFNIFSEIIQKTVVKCVVD